MDSLSIRFEAGARSIQGIGRTSRVVINQSRDAWAVDVQMNGR
jgi:hypothetical protein